MNTLSNKNVISIIIKKLINISLLFQLFFLSLIAQCQRKFSFSFNYSYNTDKENNI